MVYRVKSKLKPDSAWEYAPSVYCGGMSTMPRWEAYKAVSELLFAKYHDAKVVRCREPRPAEKSLGEFAGETMQVLVLRIGTSLTNDIHALPALVDAEVLRRAAVKP